MMEFREHAIRMTREGLVDLIARLQRALEEMTTTRN